jgi:hypothetical protein
MMNLTLTRFFCAELDSLNENEGEEWRRFNESDAQGSKRESTRNLAKKVRIS